MPAKFNEDDFLMCAALRFDGWKYWQQRCRTYQTDSGNLSVLTVKLTETREFHAEQFDNLAAFFALQRFLSKWGGEYKTRFSDEHVAFRQLFLHTYRDEIPKEFRLTDYYSRWELDFKPIREELAAQIRRAFRPKGRGAPVADKNVS